MNLPGGRPTMQLTGAALAVLIDQEGGRVQRLGPPHWPLYPAGAVSHVDTNTYLEVSKGELENTRIYPHDEIDEFVPRKEIDDLYLVRPFYIFPIERLAMTLIGSRWLKKQ